MSQFVRGQPGSTGPGAAADYLVQNGTPLSAEHGLGSIRPAWTFQLARMIEARRRLAQTQLVSDGISDEGAA